jgi:mono/diheme cytochrome c family protein
VFAQKCALCHGPDGRGDGPGSAALNPKPRNFHDQAYMKTRTDAELLEVIRNGKGVMPKWGGLMSEAEMKAVLAHVRELGEKP